MARNLLKAAPGLLVHSASATAYAELASHGAVPTDDRRRIGQSDIVFLSLPGDSVVEQVLCGPDGLSQFLRPGSIVVDTSTIGYTCTRDLAGKLAGRQVHFVDAPVSGMAARAADGTLTAMCGGNPEALETARPYLASIASSILYMGESGTGQLAKLVNQLLFDINCAALAEVLPMAVKLGLDAGKISAIVNSGTGRSYASEFFVPRMLERNFSDGYPMRHAYKDLVSGAELGARMGIPLPVLAAATATYQSALLQGHGTEDKGAMVKVFEKLLGVEFQGQPA